MCLPANLARTAAQTFSSYIPSRWVHASSRRPSTALTSHLALQAFRAERASWRAVVLLNVVRSIRVILEAIADVQALQPGSPAASPTLGARALPGSRPPSVPPPDGDLPQLTPEHLKLRLRLVPLLQVEEVLVRKLNPVGVAETEATHLAQITNVPREVAVNSQFQWKGIFNRITGGRPSMDSEAINWEDPDVSGCAEFVVPINSIYALCAGPWADYICLRGGHDQSME